MKTLIIIYVILIVFSTIFLFLSFFADNFPQIFDGEEFKVWKKCYEDDGFELTERGTYGKGLFELYKSQNLPYTIFHSSANNAETTFILDELDNVVFCSYYKKHARKLYKKVKKQSSNID